MDLLLQRFNGIFRGKSAQGSIFVDISMTFGFHEKIENHSLQKKYREFYFKFQKNLLRAKI